jgi:hypothetical protein
VARVAVGHIEPSGDVVIHSDAVGFLFLFALAKPVVKAVGKAAKKGKLGQGALKLAEAGAKGSAKGAEQGVKARAAGARDDTTGSR